MDGLQHPPPTQMTIVEIFLGLVGYGVVANIGFAFIFCFLRFRKFNRSLK
jgi:hypothetical protein